MHFSELIRWELYEERGIVYEQSILNRGTVNDALATGASPVTSLEVLDAIVGLLNDQVQTRILNSHMTMLPSKDIHYLYEAYTKLNFRLQLSLPQMRFRDWHSFDRRFSEAQNDLDRRIIGRPELDWFDEPTQIIRDAVESGWAIELFTSIDAGVQIGWPHVVMAMESLKRNYSSARDTNDFANVARGAKGVLEKLSDAVWSTGNYQTPEGIEDGPGRIKNRLETVILADFSGKESGHLIKLMRAANDFTDEVQHRRNPARYEATVTADSALFLANIMWITLTHRPSDEDVPS